LQSRIVMKKTNHANKLLLLILMRSFGGHSLSGMITHPIAEYFYFQRNIKLNFNIKNIIIYCQT
jgi:hypothetical protein